MSQKAFFNISEELEVITYNVRSTCYTMLGRLQEDDQDEEGDEDEHDSGRTRRRRSRAALDGSDYDEAEEDEDDKEDRFDRYDDDGRFRANSRSKPFPGMKTGSRAMARGGGRERGDRFGGGEFLKEVGRSVARISGKYGTSREPGNEKCRGRGKTDNEKMKERERGRSGDQPRGGTGKERDGSKGEGLITVARGKERESDAAASRAKRKDASHPLAPSGEADEKLLAVNTMSRDRVDRSKDKPSLPGAGKKVRRTCVVHGPVQCHPPNLLA